ADGDELIHDHGQGGNYPGCGRLDEGFFEPRGAVVSEHLRPDDDEHGACLHGLALLDLDRSRLALGSRLRWDRSIRSNHARQQDVVRHGSALDRDLRLNDDRPRLGGVFELRDIRKECDLHQCGSDRREDHDSNDRKYPRAPHAHLLPLSLLWPYPKGLTHATATSIVAQLILGLPGPKHSPMFWVF